MNSRDRYHKPSSPEFNPEHYVCHGVYDTRPPFDPFFPEYSRMALKEFQDLVEKLRKVNPKHHNISSCTHCGHHLRYVAVMVHTPTNEVCFIGEDCLERRFGLTLPEFKQMRENSKATVRRTSYAKRLEEFGEEFDIAREWAMENPEGVSIGYVRLDAYYAEKEGKSDMLCFQDDNFVHENGHVGPRIIKAPIGKCSSRNWDLARRVLENSKERKEISEAQANLVVKCYLRWLEENKKDKEKREKAVPIVEGRREIVGTVISKKWDSGLFPAWKITIKEETGNLIWGTCPKKIEDEVEKGCEVKFVGTVSVSERDPMFGFFKRPSKPEIVSLKKDVVQV